MRRGGPRQLTPVLAGALSLMFATLAESQTLERGIDLRGRAQERLAAEPRVALVIGNGAYRYDRLRNPVSDARAVAATLGALGFRVTTLRNADLKSMRRAVIEFGRQLGNGGVGLFYYAGHGVQVDGVNYLIPLDAQIEAQEHVAVESMSLNQVLARMGGARNRLNIVILDACRNNPFAGAFRSPARGLAQTVAPSGTYIAFATAPGEVALDGDGVNSLFTSALLKAARRPGLKLEEVFKRVRARVQGSTAGKQVPWTQSSITGDFYFGLPTSKAGPQGTEPAPGPGMERLFWESVKDSTDPSDFEAYLERFPDGLFATLADNRLRALGSRRTAMAKPGIPASYRPGETFRDCDACPEMVVIPPGSFIMGAPSGDKDRSAREEPVHGVRIAAPLAVGKYEVTFAQWEACVADGGCNGYVPDDRGWGRGERPVIATSWKDAEAYLRWLAARTGHAYRLLTEAEWEYVARAGTTTAYWWGDQVGGGNANCDGCGSAWDDRGTAPVGSFRANWFGLHDVAGNVWEWVEDCWHERYDGAPADGGAWTVGEDCQRRVLRGGSWNDYPKGVRSAVRASFDWVRGLSIFGFRVARTLP